MSMDTRRIGFFDSGIGGLTVLEKFKSFSYQELVYFADFKNLPYGHKTAVEIQRICESIVRFFIHKKIFTIVIACNTATLVAFHHLQKIFPQVTFITAVDRAIEDAVCATQNKKIGLMATPRVVQDDGYSKIIQNAGYNVNLFQEACFDLASLIEDGDEKKIVASLENHILKLRQHDIDTLILGCTHYGLVSHFIAKIAPDLILITSDNHILALQDTLKLRSQHDSCGKISFYVSSDQSQKVLDSTYLQAHNAALVNIDMYE